MKQTTKSATQTATQRGFTLIELLVVIFMIGMVAAALIFNFRKGENQKRVNLARDNVILALRTAQNYALAGRQIPPASQAPHVRGPARTAGNNAAASYWVEFSSSAGTIDLMAEDVGGAIMRVQRFDQIQRTNFSTTASPFTLNEGTGSANHTALAVRFTPPFGTMTATSDTSPLPNDFGSFVGGTIVIQSQDATRSRTITVDGISGKIE